MNEKFNKIYDGEWKCCGNCINFNEVEKLYLDTCPLRNVNISNWSSKGDYCSKHEWRDQINEIDINLNMYSSNIFDTDDHKNIVEMINSHFITIANKINKVIRKVNEHLS